MGVRLIKKELIIWFFMLIFTGILSVFIHETGHGISAYLKGYPVSTGFNKVGDFGKRPRDIDFRAEHEKYENPWDMGPLLTLLLAIVFTYLLVRVDNTLLLYLIGGFAFVNSFLRLLPIIISYSFLLFKGSLVTEDEIVMGILWYKMLGLLILKYLPSMISVIVSAICLKNVLRIFYRRLPSLMSDGWLFTVTSLSAFLVLVKIIPFLDERFRIDWIR